MVSILLPLIMVCQLQGGMSLDTEPIEIQPAMGYNVLDSSGQAFDWIIVPEF
jgi:hypothetical protein